MSIVLSPRTLAMAFNFLSGIHCAHLLRRLYREGGDKSVIASRHVSDMTAAYLRKHCGGGDGEGDGGA